MHGCAGVFPAFLVGCSLLAYMVFDVGLQGSRPRVGFSLHIAGYVFRTLFKSEAVEGGVSAGIPRMSRLLSTLLLLVVLICGSLLVSLFLLDVPTRDSF